MKKIFLAVFSLSLLTLSCSDKWDDHYQKGSEITSNDEVEVLDITITEFFNQKSEYSEFYNTLCTVKDSTKIAGSNPAEYTYTYFKDELSRDQDLTLWVIDNSVMQGFNLGSKEMKDKTMKYHVNNIAYNFSDLKDKTKVMSMSSGIYLDITKLPEGTVLVNYDPDVETVAKVLKSYQLKDGCIHIISDVLVPKVSMYEYIELLPEEYSIIRDTIINRTYKKFNISRSTPVGVDITGNTIYDSVFDLDNPLFATVNITDKASKFTMLVPSDKAILACVEEVEKMYAGMNRVMAAVDSLFMFQWIKEAIFYKNIGMFTPEAMGDKIDVSSAYKRVWRTTVQKIEFDGRIPLNNGEAYPVTYIHVPNYEILKKLNEGRDKKNSDDIFPSNSSNGYIFGRYSDITKYGSPEETKNKELQELAGEPVTGLERRIPASDAWGIGVIYGRNNVSCDYSQGTVDKDPVRYSIPRVYETVPVVCYEENDEIKIKELSVPTGEYTLFFSADNNKACGVQIFFNGDPKNVPGFPETPLHNMVIPGNIFRAREKNNVGATIGKVLIEPSEPGSKMGTFSIKFVIPKENAKDYAVGDTWRWRLETWSLLPTVDNY